ncbi:MAG: NosR/NirI family nitrous oxide reductase transcriptional regulator [Myxococcota bacterium]|jgi:NosR/NirI family nitrous oxide reductase transcriptional regulator
MPKPALLNISLEFSSKLGVRELPDIDGSHESNISGLYVVGDLADAPIIKVALSQGHDIATKVAATLKGSAPEGVLDILIIGAGPAGIGAALALKETDCSFAILERERPFATIQNFPKGKLIFSEPREMASPANLWFEDAAKEDLVQRWDEALSEHSLPIQQPEEVVSIDKKGGVFEVKTKVGEGGLTQTHLEGGATEAGAENVWRARRIILATGKRGQVRRLGIPGEDLDHVQYALKDPAIHAEQRVLVVGGGDSAVETAIAVAKAGGEVAISYRKDGFHRVKKKNQQRIDALIEAGKITAYFETAPTEFTADSATLSDGTTLTVDTVFICIGTKLPTGFLKRIGVRMKGEMTRLRVAWILSFSLITYLFYILKSGVECLGGTANRAVCEGGQWVAKKGFFPFGADDPLSMIPGMLKIDLGFRVIDGAFWGTSIYALLILVFGIRAMAKYPAPEQKKRYRSLIIFQWIFLFGIPEVIAPLVISAGGEGGLFWTLFGGDRAWKFYALSVPWPLNIWALIDAPSWAATGSTTTVVLWLLLAAAVSFIALPLYIRRNGQRFCSYLCGCGGLAETLGDFWRHLAPRGITAKKSESFGRIIMLLAVPVTLLILNDAWGFFATDALYSTKSFAQQWYGMMVDFWLASVVGVALYPYLGNRVWCRFFCPLRAYMEELARRFSTIAIKADDRCIGCGECTRYCQMGIDVQQFAQTQTLMDNQNSSCIQCGICVQVCPMEVLEVSRGEVVRLNLDTPLRPPHAEWEVRSW